MLIYEYKIDANKKQYAAIDEAIKIVQFIRNKCIRLWVDERGISSNDLQLYCATLARDFPFANLLNSQAPSSLRRSGMVRHFSLLRQLQSTQTWKERLSQVCAM